mgnify:CR=1 FL=1
MRDLIWTFLIRNREPGVVLPKWLLIIRAFLSPLQFFYWYMNRNNGYQLETDVWLIHGIKYSNTSLKVISNSCGKTYKITRQNDTLVFEEIK